MWSVDPHDWDETESAEIVERAVGRSGAGDIILLHDGWTSTSGDPSSTAPQGKPQVVESIVDGLTGSGLGVRSVGELLQVGPGRKRVWFDSG
jgi:hypothetical protein